MKAPFAHRKIVFLTAAVLASAGASTMMFAGVSPEMRGKAANVLGIMHDRSPGTRAAGAKSNKHKIAMAAAAPKKRVSQVLPTAVPAATPAEAAPPIAGAAAPIPAAIAPLVAPAALIPAAASNSGFFIPPLFIPPGGGGGGIVLTPTANPPGGGDTPPPVPGVPEPSTWAMMIFGFLFVGGLLRRRQRQEGLESASRVAVPTAR
jgi:PEP-CTERM motif-containing protein